MAQFTIPRYLEKEFRASIAEDNVYTFSGVSAIQQKTKSYTYDVQSYILQFTSNTKVHHLQSRGTDIPHYAFNFCSFDGLSDKTVPSKPLLDLIGVISDIGPYDFAGPKSQKKNRKIRIRNLEDQEQLIVLWDNEGKVFDEDQVITKSKDGVVVVIFAGLTASKFAGKHEASSTSATRVYINLDYTEVTKYQTSYKWGTPAIEQRLPNTPQKTTMETIGKLHTIEEILQQPFESFKEGKAFSCIGEITDILDSMNWYYKACKKCKTGYNMTTDPPTQRCSCKYSVLSPQFKLPLRIKDSSSAIDCIAFYNVAEDLIGSSALEVTKNMQVEPDSQAPSLKTCIGKKMIFQIGMSQTASSKNPIRYVLKRSFTMDDQATDIINESGRENPLPQESQTQDGQSTPLAPENMKSVADGQSNSQAKRRLPFNKEDQADPLPKQQKTD